MTDTTPATADQTPDCPECGSEYAYENGHLMVCPMCGHEWVPGEAEAVAEEAAAAKAAAQAAAEIRDSVGNVLQDGDDVTIVRDLEVKGGTQIKRGTKVTGIRILDEPVNDHDIDGRVPGVGTMYLKSSVVKKL